MKFARLLIATVVLAALGGVVWWSNKQEAAKADKPDPKAAPKILELKESEIKGIQIQHKDGETTVLAKDDSGKWKITAPKPLVADQAAVTSMTALVGSLSSDRMVDANATDLASYGLEPPQIGVTFTLANGSTRVLRIGEDTPTGSNTYAKVDGDNRLFTMAGSNKSSFDKQSKDLREKHLLIFENDKLSRLELEVAGKPPIEFGRAGMDWQILKPKTLRADGFQVEDLVRKLKDASMNPEDDAKTAASAFASGPRVATVKVTGAEGTLTLEVHKSKDDYYAKSSMVDGVFKVGKDLGDGMNKSLDDFRNKKVFDFGFNDPTRIEVKDGAKMVVFEKSGDKWTSAGKTMDSISVQNLIDKLRDLAATKFEDHGFATPAIEITVLSDDGKRTEKVQVSPAGANFLARRENDASLYLLDAKAISDLRESVDGVKEPPPPDTSKDGKKEVVPPPSSQRSALHTDLYQLTMAAGYFQADKTSDRATFELYVRRLPPNRKFLLAAGLEQAVDYLLHLQFTAEEIAYLRTLPQFANAPGGFFEMLASLKFTGDLFAVPEGTPMFAGEPFLTVRAPLVEAQLVETYLLATIGFQTMIATKAARVVRAALGRTVVEFGTRRAHSPEAGVLAGRASYIGGCAGTSNAETGFRYGVPVFGTSAHSWVMSFPDELTAFRQLQQLLGEHTVQLIDTYDTIEGSRRAASLGRPLWGVRLDSGNLAELAPAVRRVLDDAGLSDVKIMATGDLNEYKIHELLAARVPIDVFGVGTELSTSADAPTLGVVYKLVELETAEGSRHPVKLSRDKHSLPGAKQIFRYADHDVLGRANECPSCPGGTGYCEALQRPVIIAGALVEPLPSAAAARRRATDSLPLLPPACLSLFEGDAAWRVDLSADLTALDDNIRSGLSL